MSKALNFFVQYFAGQKQSVPSACCLCSGVQAGGICKEQGSVISAASGTHYDPWDGAGATSISMPRIKDSTRTGFQGLSGVFCSGQSRSLSGHAGDVIRVPGRAALGLRKRRKVDTMEHDAMQVAPGQTKSVPWLVVAALCVESVSNLRWQLDAKRNWMPRGD